ncbi:purine-nucleoside phosphorylase [Sulfurisphaera javensis]|uniref:Purine-nucleoside phosphorylase n=1 Tax=Sulfurisphaera javensis TaxID=2049879 RepID=A0AAT9GTS4_9CREN
MLVVDEKLPENAILVEEPEIAELLSSFISVKKKIVKRGYHLYISDEVVISTHGVGGPSLALILDELIRQGVKKAIRYGTCGSPNEKYKVGSYFIPIGVARYFSSSLYQRVRGDVIHSLFPDLELAYNLYKALKDNGKEVYYGEIFQSDDFYAEEDINQIIDMETGTLFLLSSNYGIKSASALIIANYKGKNWINYEEIYKADFPIILSTLIGGEKN